MVTRKKMLEDILQAFLVSASSSDTEANSTVPIPSLPASDGTSLSMSSLDFLQKRPVTLYLLRPSSLRITCILQFSSEETEFYYLEKNWEDDLLDGGRSDVIFFSH